MRSKKANKSEFEKCCDELKHQFKDEIKSHARQWPTIENVNKNCASGKTNIKSKHCSKTIRRTLSNFIDSECNLEYCCYSRGKEGCCPYFVRSQFDDIYSCLLIDLFAKNVHCDSRVARNILCGVIGPKQFDFVLRVCDWISFWMKMSTSKSCIKAMGTSQRTDCISFAPTIAIKIKQNALFILSSSHGLIGTGFAALIEDPRYTKYKTAYKNARGKQNNLKAMIMLKDLDVRITFAVRKNTFARLTTADITMEMKSDRLRSICDKDTLQLELAHDEKTHTHETDPINSQSVALQQQNIVLPQQHMSLNIAAQDNDGNGATYAYRGSAAGMDPNLIHHSTYQLPPQPIIHYPQQFNLPPIPSAIAEPQIQNTNSMIQTNVALTQHNDIDYNVMQQQQYPAYGYEASRARRNRFMNRFVEPHRRTEFEPQQHNEHIQEQEDDLFFAMTLFTPMTSTFYDLDIDDIDDINI